MKAVREDVDASRLGRNLARRLRFLGRPTLALAALLLAFAGGRWSTRSTGQSTEARHTIDTPAIRDAADLEKSLVNLEADLEVGQAMVAHQRELKRRHERVSALACTAAQSQDAAARRLAAAKARRASQGHHLASDEDHEEADELEPPKTRQRVAARRAGAQAPH